ncbi:MAG TPA: DUF547 domain-containing protein [Candidatus Omnitrophota bacterium]|nr:DUF547 domain-containing protein [Candidatus Omnitrophota bacterium]
MGKGDFRSRENAWGWALKSGLALTVLFLLSGWRPGLAQAFDHQYSRLGTVLGKYTVEGLVNYKRLKKSPGDLDGFLESANALSKEEYDSWRDREKTAFWINVYNATVLRVVSDYYPFVKRLDWRRFKYPKNSIQQIPNVWKQKLAKVFGRQYSLDEIRQDILAREFKDPRIYFALTDASMSSPRLRNLPYLPDVLSTTLDEQCRRFLKEPQNFERAPSGDKIFLSRIFEWHREEFGGENGILAFVRKYAPEGVRDEIPERAKIKWLEYEWALNEK